MKVPTDIVVSHATPDFGDYKSLSGVDAANQWHGGTAIVSIDKPHVNAPVVALAAVPVAA